MTLRRLLPVLLIALGLPAAAHADTVWTGAGNGVDCTAMPGTCATSGPALGATVASGRGLAEDAAGNVYFADGTDYRVKRIAPDGTITAVAGDGTTCDLVGNPTCGDGFAATSAQIGSATGIAFTPAGDLLIADYKAEKIRMVRASDGKMTTIAGSGGMLCASPPCGASGQPAATVPLNRLQGVVAAPDGTIYFAETDSFVIRQLTPNGLGGYALTTFAGDGVKCDPNNAPCGDGSPVTGGGDRFSYPIGLALDATAKHLYVADWGSDRVRRIDLDTGLLSTVAGGNAPCNPPTGVCGDGGPATAANLWEPEALSIAPDNTLYIADRADYRIRRVAPDGKISSIVGNGVPCAPPAACGDGGAPAGATTLFPWGVLFDAHTGRLWWTEDQNARVRFLAPTPAATTDPPQAVASTSGTLAATLKTDGLPVSYRFEYGPTYAYGFQSSTQSAALTRAPQAVTLPLTNLAPGSTTHYRVVATDAGGASSIGADAVLVTTAGGGGGTTTSPTTAAITSARLDVRWKKGASTGSLVLVGSTDGVAALTVTLRRVVASGTKPVRGWAVNQTAAGAFDAKLPLPKSLLPGRYRVDVTGSSAGGVVPRVAKDLSLKGPPTGIVKDAYASATLNGPPAASLPGRRKIVFATFRFAALPTKGIIKIGWIGPHGQRFKFAVKPRRTVVTGTLSSTGTIPAGRYQALLLVGGVELRRVSVHLG